VIVINALISNGANAAAALMIHAWLIMLLNAGVRRRLSDDGGRC
jgi:hypothetical protein